MRFSVQREVLLKPLSQVVGVVERRQTLPVLANLLVVVSSEGVSFTGTDLEVEMIARTAAEQLEAGELTVPARKLFDICRALPDGIKVDFRQNGDRVTLSAGRSRFTLSTLPASEFPQVDNIDVVERVTLPEATPVHEAAQLQRDLARAEIFPFAWVVNQSLTPLALRDPLLRARRAHEAAHLRELVGRCPRIVLEPWSTGAAPRAASTAVTPSLPSTL